jgi:murein DD-endopeptidase MepM/ murein hydrolase activator NlpD
MRYLLVVAIGLGLLAGSARAAEPPVLGFSISSGQGSARPLRLPSHETPNAPGSISLPVAYTTRASNPRQLPLPALNVLWQQAGSAYGIPWQVLASINKIESNFGQNMGPSSAGAVGWMQFMPSTWLRWGVDADGDSIADPWNPKDAIFAAARYLAAAGGQTDISRAIFAYNHADWYVREVLDLARVYGQGGLTQTLGLQNLQGALDEARQGVVAANAELIAAKQVEAQFAKASERLHAKAEAVELLSDRLAAQKRAALFDVRLDDVRGRSDAASAKLEQAHTALERAQQEAVTPSFAQGVGSLMGAPSFQNDYVFPVGGGPQTVSVGHTHHDYPAADIAAPMGAPIYALSNGFVESAWHSPAGACGIGLRFRTQDGLLWIYCHLSYLQPSVTAGAQLSAGTPIGLVGSTGHSTGPHLHLGLKPATGYPQEMPWFQSFAGRAFRWQDAPTELEPTRLQAPTRVFAVLSSSVPESRDAPMGFTRGGA